MIPIDKKWQFPFFIYIVQGKKTSFNTLEHWNKHHCILCIWNVCMCL